MSSRIAKSRQRTAAWRISLWSGMAFAVGTAFAFWFLQSFLARDIQNRADSWLRGELGVLADVAERTPEDRLHDVVVREVAELASREVPHTDDSPGAMDRAVFFIETTAEGRLKLHTGAGTGAENVTAILKHRITPGVPRDVEVEGFAVPFRVAEANLASGDRIYLALSTSYERQVLRRLRFEIMALWFAVITLGTSIVFVSTRRMLHRVKDISETAASIGRSNLSSRVPSSRNHDEISHLASTLNQMLDRIEVSVQQLHTMSDSLAHDLRSPITSIRGKLELALMSDQPDVREDAIVTCIEQVDRLSTLFSTSLDVSEARADALRLRKETVDLDKTIRSMVGLYEPSFSQAGLNLLLRGSGPVYVQADAALLQRTVANLFDNELKHLKAGTTVTVSLNQSARGGELRFEDDGAGFPQELLPRVFERYVKGPLSDGHGLGLAFVAAVVRSHNGSVSAHNRAEGGASIVLEFP